MRICEPLLKRKQTFVHFMIVINKTKFAINVSFSKSSFYKTYTNIPSTSSNSLSVFRAKRKLNCHKRKDKWKNVYSKLANLHIN